MKKDVYEKWEIINKIEKAIADEHKNSKAFQDWNPGKSADERKKAEEYVCSRLVGLLHEF